MRQADGGVAREQGVATNLSAGALAGGKRARDDIRAERARGRVADDQSDKGGGSKPAGCKARRPGSAREPRRAGMTADDSMPRNCPNFEGERPNLRHPRGFDILRMPIKLRESSTTERR